MAPYICRPLLCTGRKRLISPYLSGFSGLKYPDPAAPRRGRVRPGSRGGRPTPAADGDGFLTCPGCLAGEAGGVVGEAGDAGEGEEEAVVRHEADSSYLDGGTLRDDVADNSRRRPLCRSCVSG